MSRGRQYTYCVKCGIDASAQMLPGHFICNACRDKPLQRRFCAVCGKKWNSENVYRYIVCGDDLVQNLKVAKT